MAKIEIELLIKDAQASESVNEIKQSLKQLKSAMIQAGEGSAEFDKLAQAAAGLKEKMNQANEAVANFNPDALEAVGNFAGKAAAGVSLVTGAMGLFGKQSEDTEKALMKVQAAMAFAQGIQGVKDFGKALKGLFAVIEANPIGLIATVIGAIAVEVVVLYNNYKNLNSEVHKAEVAFEKQKEITQKLSGEYDRQIALLQAQGASEKDIIEVKKKKIDVQIAEIEASIKLHIAKINEIADNDSLYESYLKTTKGVAEFLGQKEYAETIEKQIQANKLERAAEDKKAIDEQLEQLKDLQNDRKLLDIELQKSNEETAKKWKETQDQKVADAKAANDALIAEQDRITAELYAQMEEQNAELEKLEQQQLQHRIDLYRQDLEAKKKLEEEKIKAAHRAAERERKIAEMRANWQIDSIRQVLSIAGELTKKNANAQKAIGAAMTLVDTYVAAQKAFTSQIIPGDPTSVIRGYISAGLAVAAGLARVKSILSVDTSGNSTSVGGGDMGGGNGGGTLSIAPNISQATQPSTLLNEQGQVINQQTQQQAYVSVVEINSVNQNVQATELRSRF